MVINGSNYFVQNRENKRDAKHGANLLFTNRITTYNCLFIVFAIVSGNSFAVMRRETSIRTVGGLKRLKAAIKTRCYIIMRIEK